MAQVKSPKQIAAEYGICSRTLRTWISKIPFFQLQRQLSGEKKSKRIYTPREIQIIYEHYGDPGGSEKKSH